MMLSASSSLIMRFGIVLCEVFSAALREYVARHAPDEVTEAINLACERAGVAKDEFVAEAARRILERTEW